MDIVNFASWMSGIYIHIPVCASKCLYCDFYSKLQKYGGFDQKYISLLLNEFNHRMDELREPVETIYIGGGTPSLINPDEIHRLLDEMRTMLGNLWDVEEITIEVNPEHVSASAIEIWKDAGINRVSVGVQSFNDTELRKIGRIHSSERASETVRMLVSEFDNVSIDVICGLPGQTPESWHDTCRKAFESGVKHISAYTLETDNDSALSRLLASGKISLPEPDETRDNFLSFVSMADKEGFRRYEISNFAVPEFDSRHNSSYWKGLPYLGLGPAASSYDGERIRRINLSDLKAYMEGKAGYEEEYLSDEQLRIEFLLTRLRTAEGINLDDFKVRFGEKAESDLKRKCIGLAESEDPLILIDGNYIRLSREGSLVSDFILSTLV